MRLVVAFLVFLLLVALSSAGAQKGRRVGRHSILLERDTSDLRFLDRQASNGADAASKLSHAMINERGIINRPSEQTIEREEGPKGGIDARPSVWSTRRSGASMDESIATENAGQVLPSKSSRATSVPRLDNALEATYSLNREASHSARPQRQNRLLKGAVSSDDVPPSPASLSMPPSSRTASFYSSALGSSTSRSRFPSSSRRDSKITIQMEYRPVSGMTNGTFTNDLCAALNDTVGTLSVMTSPEASFFVLPSCVSDKSPHMTGITLFNMIIANWSAIPSTVTLMSLESCIFPPAPPAAPSLPIGFIPASTIPTAPMEPSFEVYNPTGYDGLGNLDWNSIWAILPQISSVTLNKCNLPFIPPTLAETITQFTVYYNTLAVGAIPSKLFSRYASVSSISKIFVDFSATGISGSIPPDLLAPLAGGRGLKSFQLALGRNAINSTIPASLLAPLESANLIALIVVLAQNSLTGTIPSTLIPSGMIQSGTGTSIISINLSNNALSGTLPERLLSNLTVVGAVTFLANDNKLTGPLPSKLWNNTWYNSYGTLDLELSRNQITGTIPDTYFSSSFPSTGGSLSSIIIALNSNQLTGTIPETFFCLTGQKKKRDFGVFGGLSANSGEMEGNENDADSDALVRKRSSSADICMAIDTITLDLSNNKLSGSIPPTLLMDAVSTSGIVTLNMQSNNLSGTLSSLIIDSINTAISFTLNAKQNSLTGSPPASCNGMSFVTFDLSNNYLDGTIPAASLAECKSLTYDVSNNFGLHGPIPPELFNITTLNFKGYRTSLSGTVPPVLGIKYGSIDLSSTPIDFCSNTWNVLLLYLNPSNCRLDNSTAACLCQPSYDLCSTICNLEEPSDSPLSDDSPIPASPSNGAPTSSPCSIETKPSADFICVDGVWTAPSTSTPILTIPSGAGTVVVEGNVTSTSIVFNGVGSQIVIGGCATNLTMVTVELTQEQLKQLGSSKTLQTLLTFSNASCGSDLSSVALDTKVSRGCRKVKTEKVVSSDGNTFGAYFTMNASGCNTWWIILVSVICGVIVLGVVAAVVAGVLWKQHQEKKDFGRLSPSGSASARS